MQHENCFYCSQIYMALSTLPAPQVTMNNTSDDIENGSMADIPLGTATESSPSASGKQQQDVTGKTDNSSDAEDNLSITHTSDSIEEEENESISQADGNLTGKSQKRRRD